MHSQLLRFILRSGASVRRAAGAGGVPPKKPRVMKRAWRRVVGSAAPGRGERVRGVERIALSRSKLSTLGLLSLGATAALFACGTATVTPADAGPAPSASVPPDGAPIAEDAALDAATDASVDATRHDAEAGPVGCGLDKLRVVTGNLSGAGGTYDDGRGIRIFKGLAADVALVQELRFGDNSPAAVRAFADAAFGTGFMVVRGQLARAVDIPNAVVSRYPILDSGEWVDPFVGNRTFVWARIDVPGTADLYAISVHLLTTNGSDRANEAASIVERVKLLPPGSLVVLGGDLNTGGRSETAVTTLRQSFEIGAPYPVDQAGNPNTNAPRSRPYDWVLAGFPLDACQRPVTVGAATFSSGLVFDSRVYTPLADFAPIELSDSDSPLQHMAVVRDFSIPK